MSGLMSAGGSFGDSGKFLGYMEAIVNHGSQYYDSGSDYFIDKTFKKTCKVRIIAHVYSHAGSGMDGITVNLSGVGSIINASSTGNLQKLNAIYTVHAGQTLTAHANAPYDGASGYVVYLEE